MRAARSLPGARACLFAGLCLSIGLNTASAAGTHARPTLTVEPIPTATSRAPGTPQVTWSTGNGSPGLVTVSAGGAKEIVFSSGSEGTAPAPWISIGQSYVFRLYSDISGRRLLALIKVGHSTSTEIIAP